MRTPPDLFAANPGSASPEYVALRDPKNADDERALYHCLDLWRDFASLADSNFVAEFPNRLHERWFEMYFTVALLRAGFDVFCSKPGPDVRLTIDGQKIWIEATCAGAGDDDKPNTVPEHPTSGVWSVPHDLLALRVSNALSTKQKRYREYLEDGTVAADDVLAVAINVYGVPHGYQNMEFVMRRVFYGIGFPTLTFAAGKPPKWGVQQVSTVPKIADDGTHCDVNVACLVDGSMPHISAVIGSRANPWNLLTRLGGDFLTHPSPVAHVPWPPHAIPLGVEWEFAPASDGHGGWDFRQHEHATPK